MTCGMEWFATFRPTQSNLDLESTNPGLATAESGTPRVIGFPRNAE